ncbi:MAG: glycosyltransferase family 9 protein [Alphaproteobacteria bacterium]
MSSSEMQISEKILVIKLSALGDFIQALGPMAAIRKHHPNAHITLLTTKMFKVFGERCGYFDDIQIDARPGALDLVGWLSLRKRLRQGDFSRAYDLQNNDRSCNYYKLFSSKPEWVGIARGASHRNTSPDRTAGHAFDGHCQTLGLAGISTVSVDDMSWVKEDISRFNLQKPYVIFVPGSAPQHPQKRWPQESYGALAHKFVERGVQVVLLGTDAEKEVTDAISQICPQALNLTGQTSLFEIVTLAHGASGAIGNDTGPMHMIGPTGCRSLALFSSHSDPLRHAPKGKCVDTLQKDELSSLSVDCVLETFDCIEEK